MKALAKIPAPMGGMVRATSFEGQPPDTTPAAQNVRPWDITLQRGRIASRPGVSTLVGIGAAVIGLSEIEWLNSGVLTLTALAVDNAGALHVYSPSGGGLSSPGGGLGTTYQNTIATVLQKAYIPYSGGVKVYDPVAATYGTLTITGAGSIPTHCRVALGWRDRLVLAFDDTTNPNEIYFSKQGDPKTWDTTATGVGAAVNLSASQGDLGRPAQALAAYNQNRLFIGCSDSLWALNGDPLYGGKLVQLSASIGVVGPYAFTWLPGNIMLFLSRDGLYLMHPAGEVRPISRKYLPAELTGISYDNPSNQVASVCYDPWHHGVHVYLEGTVNAGYWVTFDEQYERFAFWPVTMSSYPACMHSLGALTLASATDSLVQLGCVDGNVRIFDRAVACEQASFIDYPVPLGGPGENGVLAELDVTTMAGSGAVTCAVRVETRRKRRMGLRRSPAARSRRLA